VARATTLPCAEKLVEHRVDVYHQKTTNVKELQPVNVRSPMSRYKCMFFLECSVKFHDRSMITPRLFDKRFYYGRHTAGWPSAASMLLVKGLLCMKRKRRKNNLTNKYNLMQFHGNGCWVRCLNTKRIYPRPTVI
jgi:hypothetical protein